MLDSCSESAVKGDHREPRQRACPLTAARAKGTLVPAHQDACDLKSPNRSQTPPKTGLKHWELKMRN